MQIQILLLKGICTMTSANSHVFYFYKQVDNSFTLECSVTMVPLKEIGACGYTFTITATVNDIRQTASAVNVTQSRSTAEKLFNSICSQNIRPDELAHLISDIRCG